ncbi:unnamed protein product [Candidula unifasciata]|uniref:Myotubularin-related protein 14 n=1 Tax=Candidula unifasciata TaxID=100452 RepID=A0A8S3ZDD2_9EUPU|nr:unnamed protein product [Candidula unifasciata]
MMSEHSGGTMDSEKSDEIVAADDISRLLSHFVKTSHRVKSSDVKGETIMEQCMLLIGKDYKYTVVPNLNGELCGHYPMKLIITEFERDTHCIAENVESRYDPLIVMQKMKNARCARCRSRFVVPVILYQGKHICRSATLSGAAEMFGRSTTDYLLSNQNVGMQDVGASDMFDKFRGHDIQLLKYFDVGYICDLMVEKKKTKFGMPISSSEKVDKENRYSEFSILCMPYPGCEFFKDWKDNAYMAETTMYDWGQALNDSSLDLPQSPLVEDLNINWSKYTEWSLVELTQNYFRLLLQYIRKGTKGLLIHCISGWDRTPLFISLLRLSLWADGAIHRSLSEKEILYLTLGYDWYLFGHDLPDRLSNEQEVLYFCFKVLKDISSDEFSVLPRPQLSHMKGVSPPGEGVAASRLHTVRQFIHSHVDSDINLGFQEGVLLAEELMNYPGKGSTTSLNSISSSEPQDQACFDVGPAEADEEEEWEWSRTSTLTKYEFAVICIAKLIVIMTQRRSLSPAQAASVALRHSSPVSASRRRLSSDSQQLSVKSNHFMGSPLLRSSSPMSVPQRADQSGSSNSIGRIISSADNLHSMSHGSSHSRPSTDRSSSHVSLCNEAFDINMSSMRACRLEAVSQMFFMAYSSSVHSQGVRHSSGGGLTSLLDRFAEQVGLKGRPPNSSNNTRTGV